MKCYNHNNVDAIGTCKACSKGLCKECHTDNGNSIVCTTTCITEVNKAKGLVERYKMAYQNLSEIDINKGYFIIFLGLIMVVINLNQSGYIPFLLFGLFYIFWGGHTIYNDYILKKK